MGNVRYNISLLKSRLNRAFATEKHLHTARFAHTDELASLSRDSLFRPGLTIGWDRYDRVLQVRSRQTHPELGNLGIFAPPRSGKSVMLTTQLLTWNESAIVSDPKGELYQKTAGHKKAIGHKVLVFSPMGLGNRFDPLQNITTESDLQDAFTQLLFIPHEGEGKRFTERATHMGTQLALSARLENFPLFPYLREMLRLALPGAAEHLNRVSPVLARQLLEDDYEEAKRRHFDDSFLTSCWATLSSGLRPILSETVVRSLTGCDFDPSEFLVGEEPVTLYLIWPERYLLSLRPLMKLVLGVLLEELKAAYDKRGGKECRRVLCLIDEAGVTPIHELEKHISTVNGRRISFILAYQAKSQILENHGRYNAETILNSMDTKLFFRQSSLETAEYVSRLLGYTSGFAKSESETGDHHTSQGSSEREVPLLTPQQVMQLPDWQLIGIHRNLPPFRSRVIKWWQIPELARRTNLPPPIQNELPQLPKLPSLQAQTSGSTKTPWHVLFPNSSKKNTMEDREGD